VSLRVVVSFSVSAGSVTTLSEPSTDARLLAQVRESDEDAFRILFERYHGILFRHVLFLTREADSAHEIVQETFVRIWDHRRGIDPGGAFAAYAFRIAGNLIRDITRREKRRERLDALVASSGPDATYDPDIALEQELLEERLRKAVEELPHRCRSVFLLSRIEGKSNREIAGLLGTSVRTVEHQVSHALSVLRRALGITPVRGTATTSTADR